MQPSLEVSVVLFVIPQGCLLLHSGSLSPARPWKHLFFAVRKSKYKFRLMALIVGISHGITLGEIVAMVCSLFGLRYRFKFQS